MLGIRTCVSWSQCSRSGLCTEVLWHQPWHAVSWWSWCIAMLELVWALRKVEGKSCPVAKTDIFGQKSLLYVQWGNIWEKKPISTADSSTSLWEKHRYLHRESIAHTLNALPPELTMPWLCSVQPVGVGVALNHMYQSDRHGRSLEQNEPIGVTHDPMDAIGLADLRAVHDNTDEFSSTGVEAKTTGPDFTKRHNNMVTITPVVYKLVSYVPYVLVLLELRYEGKRLLISCNTWANYGVNWKLNCHTAVQMQLTVGKMRPYLLLDLNNPKYWTQKVFNSALVH